MNLQVRDLRVRVEAGAEHCCRLLRIQAAIRIPVPDVRASQLHYRRCLGGLRATVNRLRFGGAYALKPKP